MVKKENGSDNDKKIVNKQITKKLGKDYHIDEFFELGKIPKTTNGKTDKPKIREIYLRNN